MLFFLYQKSYRASIDFSKIQFIILAILTPVLLAGTYLTIGNPTALNTSQISEISNQEDQGIESLLAESQIDSEQIQLAINTLEEKIKQNPKDLQSLNLLANTYLISDQNQKAVETLEKLIAQGQNDADTLIKTADAYAFAEQGVFNIRAKQLLSQAMQQAPNHPQGLWLSGMVAMQENDTNSAKRYWNQLLPILSGTPQEQELKNILQELESNTAQNFGKNNISAKTINVSISLSDDFANKHPNITGEEVVFVIARAKQGSNIPLAAKRLTLNELPADIIITAQDAMVTGNSIQDFQEITLSAKISKTGDPTIIEGDINSGIVDVDMNTLEAHYSIEF